jgi:predicted PP-loop superfamily ATPase
MEHLYCDMCGKPLLLDEDVRFEVKIEVYAAYDPMEITEEDLEEDFEEEIHELIEEMRDMDEEELEEGVYKSFKFDLCGACHKVYLKDPLGISTRGQGFAEN